LTKKQKRAAQKGSGDGGPFAGSDI